jgi:hypothetical protein
LEEAGVGTCRVGSRRGGGALPGEIEEAERSMREMKIATIFYHDVIRFLVKK